MKNNSENDDVGGGVVELESISVISEEDDVGGGVVDMEGVSGVSEVVIDGVGVGVTKAESTERKRSLV